MPSLGLDIHHPAQVHMWRSHGVVVVPQVKCLQGGEAQHLRPWAAREGVEEPLEIVPISERAFVGCHRAPCQACYAPRSQRPAALAGAIAVVKLQ